MLHFKVDIKISLALLASAGCSFAPDPELPQPVAALPETFVESEATGAYAPLGWWRDFDNPTLDALIDSALVSNLDLVEAVARLSRELGQGGVQDPRAVRGTIEGDAGPSCRIKRGAKPLDASEPAIDRRT